LRNPTKQKQKQERINTSSHIIHHRSIRVARCRPHLPGKPLATIVIGFPFRPRESGPRHPQGAV
jgi:hypothetical protein